MGQWAAVIGSPIAHSLSPVLHRAAWRSLGLEGWEYRAVEVDGDSLGSFVAGLGPACRGLSVTMPCKQAVIPLLDAVEPMAQAVGTVNTVVPSGGGVLTGFNTDVHGMATAIEQAREGRGGQPLRRAVILGARASASSALPALRQLGVEDFTIVARSFDGPGSALKVALDLGIPVSQVPWRQGDRAVEAIESADLVVSTVPAGVADEWADRVRPTSTQTVLDIAYAGGASRLSEAFAGAGAVVASPLEMLLHQAAVQVKLMTGGEPDIAQMRAALVGEVSRRG